MLANSTQPLPHPDLTVSGNRLPHGAAFRGRGRICPAIVDLAVANSNNANLAAAMQFRKERLKWRITGGSHQSGTSDRNRRQSYHHPEPVEQPAKFCPSIYRKR